MEGLRNIVDSMLEQVQANNFDLFNHEDRQVDDEQMIFKYSMFLASLLDARYAWFKKDLFVSGQLNLMLISEEDLETMIGFFRTACVKNDVKKPVIVKFLEFLANNKEHLCAPQKQLSHQDALIESLDRNQKFEMFIERFFSAIQANEGLVRQDNPFEAPEARQELIARVTKILHCQNSEELEVDRAVLESLPVNSDDPMFLAGECLRDTLIGIGVNEESAETARRTFLALRKNTMEETQNQIFRIASKVSLQSSKSLMP